MSKQVITNNGIAFASLLGLLFIALKLTGVISWSWIWILAPFWIGAAIGLAFLIIFLMGGILLAAGIGIFALFQKK